MEQIIANAPIQQFARKAYFWKQVNLLRNQTGLPIHVGYKYYNARELEAEYKRLSRRQVQQNVARQATRALQKRQIKQVARQATQAAQTRTRRIVRRQEEDNVQTFFMNPQPNREIEITHLSMRAVVPYITLAPGYTLLLNAGNNYWTVNNDNINQIIQDLTAEVMEIQEGQGSDAEIINIINNPNITTKFIWRQAGRRRPNGGYFKYYNKLDKIDLSKYGIYRNADETDEYKLNCLEIAFNKAGIEESKFNKLKTLIRTRYIPQKDLKTVAEQLQVYITLCKLDSHNNTTYYGNKDHQKISIGLIDEHYFLIEKTNYTSFSIKNYFEVCDKEIFNKICKKEGKKYKRREDRFISSYDLVKLLLDNKNTHLENITMANCGAFSQYSNRVAEYTDLPEIDDKELKYCRPKELQKPSIFIDIESTKEYNKLKKFLPCDYNDDDEDNTNKIYFEYDVLYFDTEATTNEESHKPYMICSEERNGEKRYFNGKHCILKWLQSLDKNYVCIAHNLRYDFQFIVRWLSQANDPIKTGNKIKSVSGKFYNINTGKTILLHFKDSYGLISMPLKKFGKCFNLDVKKEIMPYEAYNSNTVDKKLIDINYASAMLDKSEEADFIKNIEEWNLRDGDKFNHIMYANKYCELDVSVLKNGYETFRKWMLEVCNLDIDNAVSIPQLANTYGLNANVFSGCYKISGVARDFIQKCVVGGRCMVKNNEQFKINHEVDDFDGVSLYPSAMHRMEGLLMGKPKVITDEIKEQILNQLFSTEEITMEEQIDTEIEILHKLFSYNSNTNYKAANPKAYMIASRTRSTGLNLIKMLPGYSQDKFDMLVNYNKKPLTIASFIKGMSKEDLKDWLNYIRSIKKPDGYFIEIDVLDVKKYRDFPLLSRVNEKGIRIFSNDIRGTGIFVDKTALEDLIKFQEIEFNIIRGYYFNEGRNTTIKTFIKGLFDERLKKKSEKNPIQEVYKLIMNAFYGKLIMKPIEYNYSFVYNKDKFEKHLQYKFNSISQYTQITDGLYFVKESRSIMDHFSMPHCGVEVLSMSKRIMNEVMCLAEDMDIEIYYQDTDSMHINARLDANGKSGVEKLAAEFKEIYGKELVGKYLGQFHSDFDFKSDVAPISVESIYLGKKSYIDRVRVVNDGVESFEYHLRMKGIPGETLRDEVKKNYDGDSIKMYSKLLNHKSITFDLLKVCKFKTNNNFTTSNNKEFTRTLQF